MSKSITKQEDSSGGNVRLNILLGFGILILAIGVFLCFRKKDKKPIYSWKNNVDIGDGWKVSTDLKVFSEKKVTDEDGNYCGFRFGKIYYSQAKLNLIYNNKIIDTADLTNPELILPDFTEENLRYYKPWDINGDGKDQEFIIQDYSSCNSNAVSFLSASKGLKKFEKISIINKNGDEIQSIYADIAEDALKIKSGEVDSKNYDMEKGIFVENHYKFNKDKKKLIQEL
ncbi:MAG: hypothetical protein V1688_01970 [bacterium]